MSKAEQLKQIGESVLSDASLERDAIIAEADDRHTQALEECRARLEEQMQHQVQRSVTAIRREQAQARAKAQKQAHRDLLLHRDAITDQVFKEVATRLKVWCQTPAYREWLSKQWNSCKDDLSEGCVLLLRPGDGIAREALEAMAHGVPLEEDARIRLGGFRMENMGRGVAVDATLDNALAGQRPWFLETCGLQVK